MPAAPAPASSACYCITLRGAARKISAIYDAALAPVGVNIGQLSLLRRIRRHGPVSLTELGRLADLDRSTIGRNARVLEKLGLVEGRAGADQREAPLALSPAGEALLEKAAPLWDAAQAEIETRLGAEGLAALSRLAEDF
ncbi:MarR family transcriptional regulator [Pseudoroseomonas deserti]|uniref:MarR family transcriptional regulator n=1 Tax=Teichococcus deserti TaxID=1817963 RepID=A0A1V2H2T6_9PROT|nr:MarR family transcriptional regulator [Pseudoroseomonas deserti]ONG51794.1 MarR family transcriptional regulator [Pseudoroseomonas deserti]